jgi:multicomponent Na+:H+ antiporter subunit C
VNEIALRLYLLTGSLLFVIGFYGILVSQELLRKILGLNIMGSGVFLVFIAIAVGTSEPLPDPVPHAMVLTGIVVSVCGTGLALALVARVQSMTGNKAGGNEE